MKWIVIKILSYRIKRAEKRKYNNGSIVEQAYNTMINSYVNTIMFLEAEN